MSDVDLQRTPKWEADRNGCVTNSRLKDVMDFEWHTYTRGDKKGQTLFEEKATRKNYRTEKVLERLGIAPENNFTSKYMREGTNIEAAAQASYEYHTGNVITPCGFIPHPTIPNCGGSPDGLIDPKGVHEGKGLTPANHIRAMRLLDQGIMLEEHVHQVQGHMMVTEREWCDFTVRCRFFPANADFAMLRVYRDDEFIKKMEDGIRLFLSEVEDEYNYVINRNGGVPVKPTRLRDLIEESSEWDHAVANITGQYPGCDIGNMFDAEGSFNYDRSEHNPKIDMVYHLFKRGDLHAMVPASEAWAAWALSDDTTPFV